MRKEGKENSEEKYIMGKLIQAFISEIKLTI
jgi:hypothetical protein